MATQRIYRRFGSMRILRDGRVRFSARCFPELPHIGFLTRDDMIDVERADRVVLYIWLDRGRVGSFCFAYDLPPDILHELVWELRKAGRGLERWIVPGLEYTQRSNALKNDNPATYALISELLKATKDLPVAERWQRHRERVWRWWAEQLADDPENMAKVPAPWMIPDASAIEAASRRPRRPRSAGKGRPAKRSKAAQARKRRPRPPRVTLTRP